MISQNISACICVIGHFNSVRSVSERARQNSAPNRRDASAFVDFIMGAGLIDLPLCSRAYTCYRHDGTCKSRIDRVMVNNNWLLHRPNSHHKALGRILSHHCPIIMEVKVMDWGAKPFRFINAWRFHPEFRKFVTSQWKSYDVERWGSLC